MIDSSTQRRRNLSRVLRAVHVSGGSTRAELTRALRLNRSTIGDLVGALAEAGWVEERDDAPREGVGRPSPLVVPTARLLVAAVNPELDAVTVALVALGGRVVARTRIPAARPRPAEAVEIAAAAIEELAAAHPESTVVGVGVAVPGLVRTSDGLVRLAPDLHWTDEPLGEPLALRLGLPVAVGNDADLGGRAEVAFGAGAGARDLLYVNGGPSGIGGGLVVNGAAAAGSAGYAGEIGHIGLDPRGPLCACGATGCFEAIAGRASLLAALELTTADDDELERALTAAVAVEGHPVHAVLETHFTALAAALRTSVNLLNPERVVLGGHLAAVWDAVGAVRRGSVLRDALPVSAAETGVVSAALGSSRLLIGAAEIAWEAHLENPLAVRESAAVPSA
ncbi:ROK family transcriptional regulator [Microcella daejeonensis]|uniref:ROK family transcriptional regulator n=1 Tax=Microcella daejeonensis TaxID=2994971 RepID=A0A9E8MMP8_9MICO|nr:ROK family transcriptional regulator [Microcella daejeonensis]WAB82480.1 ROK family transcriptional regulator [Microcella daejeonensis]